MQATQNRVLQPPPPPPPLPLPSEKKSIPPPIIKSSTVTVIRDIIHFFKNTEEKPFCFYKTLKPVIQEGPSCGLAALLMASQYFKHDLTMNQIFSTAKHSNFTKSGEMFSAFNMATLATSLLNCEVSILSHLTDNNNKMDILKHICDGFPVLIPYDTDKDYSPCLNNGLNSHWAVLCGVCFSVPKAIGKDVVGEDIDNVSRTVDGMHAKTLLSFAENICVFAYQGKSKHIALWDFQTLLLSCRNLFEVTNKYPRENLILAEKDPMIELRDKAVLLK